MNTLPVSGIPAASAVETVTVSVRLFYRQKQFLLLMASFVGSGLLGVALPWAISPTKYVFWLAAILFWLLPIALFFVYKGYCVKPARLSFTPQGLFLDASDKQYQLAWTDLVAYKVEFSLAKMVGEGYRLILKDDQGNSVALNLLEPDLIDPDSGLRTSSALAYLCRYVGWYNRQAAGEARQISLRPSLLTGPTGWWLLGTLGTLVLVDVGIRWLHPVKTSSTIGVLLLIMVLGIQLLGQKKNDDRYIRYLHKLEEEGSYMEV